MTHCIYIKLKKCSSPQSSCGWDSRASTINPPEGGKRSPPQGWVWLGNQWEERAANCIYNKDLSEAARLLVFNARAKIKASLEQFYNSERTGCSKATPWLLPSNNYNERSLSDACSGGGKIGDCNLLGFHGRSRWEQPWGIESPTDLAQSFRQACNTTGWQGKWTLDSQARACQFQKWDGSPGMFGHFSLNLSLSFSLHLQIPSCF